MNNPQEGSIHVMNKRYDTLHILQVKLLARGSTSRSCKEKYSSLTWERIYSYLPTNIINSNHEMRRFLDQSYWRWTSLRKFRACQRECVKLLWASWSLVHANWSRFTSLLGVLSHYLPRTVRPACGACLAQLHKTKESRTGDERLQVDEIWN